MNYDELRLEKHMQVTLPSNPLGETSSYYKYSVYDIDDYNLSTALQDLNQDIQNFGDTTLDNIKDHLRSKQDNFLLIPKLFGLIINEVRKLKMQVHLQDKVIAALLGDQDAEQFLKEEIDKGPSDNLRLIEIIDAFNRLTGKEELAVNTPQN